MTIRFFILVVLCVCTLSFCGCSSIGSTSLNLNRILDKALPPDFKGDARIAHKNPYIDFTIDAGNLHRTPTGWTYDWLVWSRNGRFSHGSVRLGVVAQKPTDKVNQP